MFQNFKNEKVLVMGLGIAGGGLGVTKWLHQQGAQITITDLRNKKLLATTIAKLKNYPIKYVLGQHRARDFKSADLIIKNPAVPIESSYLKIAKKHHIPITSDIEIFSQRWPGKMIALTGTKGKSTTVNLIYHILKAAKKPCYLGGNVGETPLLFLSQAKPNQTIILELSSFQLESLKISPDISIVTNIFPDHLNRHHTMTRYKSAKANIFKNQLFHQYTVLNYDNYASRQLANQVKAKLTFFSTKIDICPKNCQTLFYIKDSRLMMAENRSSHLIMTINKIKLLGQHNLENILAAAATAYLSNIRPLVIAKAINNFTGIPHRLELVRTINNVKYYNDTTATNPGATIMALETLSKNKNIILIAGGADKNLSFDDLALKIKKTCLAVTMLSGTATPKFIKALKKINYPLKNISEFNNFKKAVYSAKAMAQPGDVVLLSPGCASFGMFTNEFDRGKKFIRITKGL
jgi:UDP-N-acetylmuramoylalanine--D-glutamate ligase